MTHPAPTHKLQEADRKRRELQGEGNYEAASRYRQSVEQFVQDGRVDQAAKDAAPRSAAQAREMKEAEQAGRRHATRDVLSLRH